MQSKYYYKYNIIAMEAKRNTKLCSRNTRIEF